MSIVLLSRDDAQGNGQITRFKL